jgi:hypothetical protein
LADVHQCEHFVGQNSSDFQDIFDPLFHDLLKDVGHVPFFQDTMRMHDALIGILLGYGKGNAWLYYQKTRTPKSPSNLPRVLEPSSDRKSSNYVWKYFTLQRLDISDMSLPVFVGDPYSDESKQLKREYLAAREKIEGYYIGKDFLSATLSLYKHGSALLDNNSEKPTH